MLNTIIMPVFNGEHYLKQAIESIITQTVSNWEFLIINDGSTDGSERIALEYQEKDNRVRVITIRNSGPAFALNIGLSESKGELIFIAHADDINLPNRLESQISAFTRDSSLSFCGSLVKYINYNGMVIGKSTSKYIEEKNITKDLFDKSFISDIHHTTMAYRREILINNNGYDISCAVNEDVEIYSRLARKGYKWRVLNEVLVFYRIHQNAASVSKISKVRFHLGYLKNNHKLSISGNAVLSYEDYIKIYLKKSLFFKINRRRKDLSHVFYKKATCHYAGKKYFKSFWYLFYAAFLQPLLVLKLLITKYR